MKQFQQIQNNKDVKRPCYYCSNELNHAGLATLDQLNFRIGKQQYFRVDWFYADGINIGLCWDEDETEMKHKRGEIIAKHLDEIFLDGYEDRILGGFKKIKKGTDLNSSELNLQYF